MAINFDSVTISHESETYVAGPPAEVRAEIRASDAEPNKISEILRFLADQVDNGTLKAGIRFIVTLELEGDFDKPIFIGDALGR